jgi:hypothetical protein
MLEVSVVSPRLEAAPLALEQAFPLDKLFASSSGSGEDVLAVRREDQADLEIPPYLLLIGGDLFGDYYCMDLRAESFGKIYFWDHQELTEHSLSLVGNDFRSFIGNLRRKDPQE